MKLKLDAIAAIQREKEREVEEKKEKERREALLRAADPPDARPAATIAPPAAPGSNKFVPRHRRGGEGSSQRQPEAADRWDARQEAPHAREVRPLRQDALPARQDALPLPAVAPEAGRWSRHAVRPVRQDAPPARQEAPPARQPDGAPPAGSTTDRWRPGGGSRPSANSSSASSSTGWRKN